VPPPAASTSARRKPGVTVTSLLRKSAKSSPRAMQSRTPMLAPAAKPTFSPQRMCVASGNSRSIVSIEPSAEPESMATRRIGAYPTRASDAQNSSMNAALL
jgi:hypothetical protein